MFCLNVLNTVSILNVKQYKPGYVTKGPYKSKSKFPLIKLVVLFNAMTDK